MKTSSFNSLTAIVLSLNLILLSIMAQEQETNSVPPVATQASFQPGKDNQMLLCLLLLSACAAGGYVIWKVKSSTCNGFECRNKRLILERSYYDGNWVAIATNDVSGICTNWQEVFRTRMMDDTACYRVHITDIPQRYLIP